MLKYNDIKRIHILLRADIKSAKTIKRLYKLNRILKYLTNTIINSAIYSRKERDLAKREYEKTFKLLLLRYHELKK